MKKNTLLKTLFFLAVAFTHNASAQTYSVTPPTSDLYDLPHESAYLWLFNIPTIPSNETIIGASISFKNIKNWRVESNDLYATLINNSRSSDNDRIYSFRDNQASGNYFSRYGVELEHYEDLPDTGRDLVYTFDPTELATLLTYLTDGRVGLGFDADCHFYNDGITFSITTQSTPDPVPEPATMLLFGTGLAGLAGIARRRVHR